MKVSQRRTLESAPRYIQGYDQPDQQGSSPSQFSTSTSTPTTQSSSFYNEKVQNFLNTYNAPKMACRPTSDFFPRTKRLIKSTSIPTAFHITPFPYTATTDDYPKADFGNKNPVVRCDKCRAYVNPFTTFQDGGQEYICNMCGESNHTPRSYYVSTDKTGQRKDRDQRAELHKGVFDIKAGTDYMSRPAMPPIYFFMIDVSQEAVANGSIESIAHILSEFVENDWFWGDVRTKVGFLAYDSDVHLISLDKRLKRPTITTLTDIENLVKLPVFEHLLVNLSENKDNVLTLLRSLPKMYTNNTNKGSNMFNAVRVSASILKRSGGRIYAFQSSSDLIKEPGFNRDGMNNTDIKQVMTANSSKFSDLTPDMHHAFITCNLYVFGKEYKDVATIAELPKLLNGDIHYYPDNKERHHRFYFDFRNSISREYTWESVFRVRVSNGWKITAKLGNYSIKSSGDLLSLPNTDAYKTLVYEVELEADVAPKDTLYLQTALLYTTAKGERRIRVINYGVQLTDDLNVIQDNIDSQAVAAALMRKCLYSMNESSSLLQVREELTTKASQIFIELARGKHKEEDLNQQNIVFLMAVLGMLKHPLFLQSSWSVGTKVDALNVLKVKMNMLNVDEIMLYFVPYLFPVHTLLEEESSYHNEDGNFIFPSLVNLSMNSLTSEGVYLMDGGDTLYMMVGSLTNVSVLQSLFGINSFNEVESLSEDMMYQNMEDPLTIKVAALITELRSRKVENYAFVHVIKEGETCDAEYDFYGKLLEDKLDLPSSYNVSFSDFVQNLSKLRRI